MSEPMSSGEIEDVLSSIRKLVSEDLRPTATRSGGMRPAPAVSSGTAAEEGEKLLLTPALRVVEDGEPSDTAPDTRQAMPSGSAPEAQAEAPAPLSLDPTLRLDLTTPEADAPVPEPSGAEPEEDRPTEEPAGAGIGAALSTIGSAVDQNRDDWESETGDGGFASLAWKAPQWVEEAEVVTPATAPVSDYEPLSPEAAEAAEAAARAEIEAAEQAAAADGSEGADEPQFRHRGRAPQQDEDETDLFAEDEPLYDEALLRDLVRDIIREELSGTLGERITRNVRKLVRAEIARAMTAREFE